MTSLDHCHDAVGDVLGAGDCLIDSVLAGAGLFGGVSGELFWLTRPGNSGRTSLSIPSPPQFLALGPYAPRFRTIDQQRFIQRTIVLH